jgi:signal transduction histidine kinase
LAEVISDKKFIKHILLNLLSNAIKFSPEGKPIELKTDVNNSLFTLSVKDSGIGISKEDQEHLFERFFRAHNATNIQGTGLGLNIVAKYVEMLNGTIECESELEKGTLFMIKLPFGG